MVAPHPARPTGPDAPDPADDGTGDPGGAGGGRGHRATWWPPAERRRRRDLLVVALLAVVAVVGTLLVLRSGDEASTTLRLASPPLTSTPPGPVPTGLVEAWRDASPATPTPVTVGPAVVTAGTSADGAGVVTGRDAATGAVGWEYRRPEPPCTVGSGFGQVLAVFATGPEPAAPGVWCSDVAALDPATGARGPARDADVRPGTRLLAAGSHVTATGADYLEVWRSDLVATVEYGRLPTPVQNEPQPRRDCVHGSVAVASGLVAVLERCPGEPSDRLSVLEADPSSSDQPETRATGLTGVVGGRLVAASADRFAVAAPDGTLRTFDGAAAPVTTVPLGPLAGPTTDPPGLSAGARPAGSVVLWWTGTGTVALDPDDLVPRWTVPGALGPGAALPVAGGTAATVVVPVAGGLAVLDADSGALVRTLPVDRSRDPVPAGDPVGVGVSGTTVVEQRGATLVALRPAG